ncbi:MAG: rRNA (uracil1498-N3)-methyltransferase [Frankiaceae bacterium]|nr:rRNA (uracil1498-N3)-methyltransferase [Frankiaceae bacterium]
MTPPLFLVEPAALAATPLVIDGPEGRHASDVRRLRAGEAVWVGDGAGTVVEGTVATVERGAVTVDVVRRREVAQPSPRFVVVQALAKGGRDEDAVEAMTEVGVDEVVAWSARRAVAKWTPRVQLRWEAVARSATKQARRPWLPVVGGPATTQQVAERLANAALSIVLHESATDPLPAPPPDGEVVVVVGPEGGIDDDELAVFRAAGGRVCRLGGNVLRASTAGVAARSAVCAATRWRL